MGKLTAGYGESSLTPPLGIELSGYGFYLERKAAGVQDDLKARALFLLDGSPAGRLLVLSCDLVGFSPATADELRAAAAAELGIDRGQVLLACTHTHTGPATIALPGVGEMDAGYMATLPGRIRAAARAAAADLGDAEASAGEAVVEPIGFNRRTNDFTGIDPVLKVIALKRKSARVLVLSYACHAVTLGRSPLVSADWPGAVVRELESRGERALVLQGCCGDVDPVTGLNGWGSGTEEDLRLYGHLLAERALKAVRGAAASGDAAVRSAERRVRVMLRVPPEETLDREAVKFVAINSAFPGAERFADEWLKSAHEHYAAMAKKPYLDEVPVQAAAVGPALVAGLPGEAFSCYGLALRKEFPGVLPAAYVNGDIGYLPPATAFMDPRDYACHCAPKFYTLFPFTRTIESQMLETAGQVLKMVRG